ncbi:hypothetical protein SB778_41925, partial [Paraburkholderia sp. SIMBA_050]
VARLAQMIGDAGIAEVVADRASAEQVGEVLAGCEVVEVGSVPLAVTDGVRQGEVAGGIDAASQPGAASRADAANDSDAQRRIGLAM